MACVRAGEGAIAALFADATAGLYEGLAEKVERSGLKGARLSR